MRATQQPHKAVTSRYTLCIGARMVRLARFVNFARGDPGKSHLLPFDAPYWAVSIPYPDWRAPEFDSSGDNVRRKKQHGAHSLSRSATEGTTLDRGRVSKADIARHLLTANSVIVAIQMLSVSRLSTADGGRASGTRGVAIGKGPPRSTACPF